MTKETRKLHAEITDEKIYNQHHAAFIQTSAYAILYVGKPVAKIAFKFPKDGADRLYAYVNWLGSAMVRGHANGYGYDKKSAAVESAISKMIAKKAFGLTTAPDEFLRPLENVGGQYWNQALENAGFTVFQVV